MRVQRSTAILLLGITLFFAGCSYLPGRSKEAALQKGDEFMKQGKPVDAAIAYRRAIQLDNNYGEAWYKLGEAELQNQKSAEAYVVMAKASDLMPDREDIKRRLVDLSLTLYFQDSRRPANFYERLRKLGDYFLSRDSNSFDGLRIEAYLARANGRNAEALGFFEKAAKVRPNQRDIMMSWAETLGLMGRHAEGAALLEGFVKNDTKNVLAYDQLYALYANARQIPSAEQAILRRIEVDPSDPAPYVRLADLYQATNRPAEASATLTKLMDATKFPAGRQYTGDYYSRLSKWPEAIAEYEAGVKSDPARAGEYERRIALALGRSDRKPEARKLLDSLIQKNPKDQNTRLLRAELALESPKKAELDLAVSDLKEVVKITPRAHMSWFLLGRAQRRAGDSVGARASYAEAMRLNRVYLSPKYELAELDQISGRHKDALRLADEVLQLDAKHLPTRLLRTSALRGLGRFDESQVELQKLLTEYPDYNDGQLQMGLLLTAMREHDKAEAIFLRLMTKLPKDPRPVAGMVELFTATGHPEKALRLLDTKLQEDINQANQLRMMMADAATTAQDRERALAEFQRIPNYAQSAEIQMRLGRMFLRTGDASTALNYFGKAASMAPGSVQAHLLRGAAAAELTQWKEAEQSFRKALALEPRNAIHMNNLAFVLGEGRTNLEEAEKLAEEAFRASPENASYADTLGMVYLRNNKRETARQVFNNLVRKYPNEKKYQEHLALAN
jgi:tetratricopeptide (TPR) repeat protein